MLLDHVQMTCGVKSLYVSDDLPSRPHGHVPQIAELTTISPYTYTVTNFIIDAPTMTYRYMLGPIRGLHF